jgi:MYXO-CTERM domain-containing protein
MKTKLAILSMLAAVSTSQAAVYSITNSIGDGSIGITQLDGKPGGSATVKGFNTTQGFGMFGYFNGLTDVQISASTDFVTLLGSFVAFNNNQTNFGATTLGNNGTITMGNGDLDVGGAGSAFDGKSIYMVFANVINRASVTALTEILVLKHNTETFDPSDDVPAQKSVTFDNSSATMLIGGYNNYQFKTRTSDTTTGPAWNTVSAIPEPSAALLGAIGALGLLRRRRA